MKVVITVDEQEVARYLSAHTGTYTNGDIVDGFLSHVIEAVQANLQFEFQDTDREIAPVVPLDGGR